MPDCLILTHGAGSNRDAPLLISLDEAFSAAGLAVVRLTLAFREARPKGPPRQGDAVRDRQGLLDAVQRACSEHGGRVFLGGHSYGGRQSSMLAAEHPGLVSGLLLLSYPLHPPRSPSQVRTAHLPQLTTPALFVHGTRDPFGTIGELRAAIGLIPAPTTLVEVPGAGHDLGSAGRTAEEPISNLIRDQFFRFFNLFLA